MVRCCRTPDVARSLFTANELSGWILDGVRWQPRKRRNASRRRTISQQPPLQKTVIQFTGGRKVS